jgi:sugar phosphate isomerase/epimerase
MIRRAGAAAGIAAVAGLPTIPAADAGPDRPKGTVPFSPVRGGQSDENRDSPRQPQPFRYSLNTGTIRGQKLPLVEEIQIAAQAGYQAIEPWLFEIADYAGHGGSLGDLRKRIADLGLSVQSVIGFTTWISEEADRGPGGFEQWKRDFELVAAIGGKRLCAPPSGAAFKAPQDLFQVAKRYRQLVQLGRLTGVVPQVELWGQAKTLSRMGEVALVLVEAGLGEGSAVLDIFHIYKGGSDFGGLRLFNGDALHSFHMNDYPAHPPRATATDADRVYPGDGIAPLPAILADLRHIGFGGMLSLEVFNRDYWKQDALTVARTGLEKMQACVAKIPADPPPRS